MRPFPWPYTSRETNRPCCHKLNWYLLGSYSAKKHGRERSGTSSIMIQPITNYFPTHHNRLFRETNSRTIRLAQDADIPDLMKFWRSGTTGLTIFTNSAKYILLLVLPLSGRHQIVDYSATFRYADKNKLHKKFVDYNYSNTEIVLFQEYV